MTMQILELRGAIVAARGSQRAVAKEAGIEETKLSNVLRGFKKLSPAEARALEQIIKRPVPSELITRSDGHQPEA